MHIGHMIAAAGLALGMAAAGTPAQAVAVTWDLSGVTFNDGGTASGSFVFDATADAYDSWNITTTGGSQVTTGFDYTNLNSSILNGSTTGLFIGTAGLVNELDLGFSGVLTNAGGTFTLSGFEHQLSGFQSRSIDGGSITTEIAATPLPAALPLFAGGLGVMGLLGWRRNRKNAAAIAAA
jgi:hypothetical protein